MKTSNIKKLCALTLTAVFAASFAGCAGGNSSRVRVKFIASGETVEYSALRAIKDEYNKTQGVIDGVEVQISYKATSDYSTYLTTTSTGSNAADIFYADDRYFKSYVQQGIVADLDELQEKTGITLDTDPIYPSGISRYRYDKDNNTSNEDDPLYGVVRGLSPTIIYYNQTAFENAGITCVSVPEEEIDDAYTQAFNQEHGTFFSTAHLKRGFVRESVVDAFDGNYENASYSWGKPNTGETMVFNNRIAMSWDEVEDLGKIMTPSYNPGVMTEYGYYTWWWFYYGFSVGGDCIEDISGEGDWVFTLKDTVPNFIVKDGFEGSVQIGEHTYSAGEIVSYRDRVTIDEATAERILAQSSDLDRSYLTEEVKALAEEGTLVELPSERDAFVRFVHLAQEKDSADEFGTGLGISPIPKNASITGDTGLFTGGKVAMIVHKSNSLLNIQSTIAKSTESRRFAWNVAPLPQYKTYHNDGTVKVHGVQGGASDSSAFCINAHSSETKQKAAMNFLRYLCSKEAQEFAAATGFTLPSRPDSVAPYLASNDGVNLTVIAEAAFYETPGDWWYMPNKTWIDDNWANDLNNSVRNNTMTLTTFFSRFEVTQAALNKFRK